MKPLITVLIIATIFTSCQKSNYKCVCTYYNWPAANTTSEIPIHDTKRKAKKQCDENNLKSNSGYIGTASHHCELK